MVIQRPVIDAMEGTYNADPVSLNNSCSLQSKCNPILLWMEGLLMYI